MPKEVKYCKQIMIEHFAVQIIKTTENEQIFKWIVNVLK